MIQIYTDGACSGNPGAGGVGVVIVQNNEKEKPYIVRQFNIHYENTTNQRMEISAAIAGLQEMLYTYITDIDLSDKTIEIHSDSAYLCNAFNMHWIDNWLKNGWMNSKKQPVANRDLWEKLLSIIEQLVPNKVTFCKVKGHNGHIYNELADKLAVDAVKNIEVNNENSNN